MIGLEPGRNRRGQVGRVAHDLLGGAALLQGDDVVGADLVARDVHAAAVDLEVAVADELPGLRARGGEAEAVDDVVDPRLEHAQQVVAGDAGALLRGLLVVGAELLLEQAVVPARLLLLAQLQQVLGLLDAAAAVLARRIRAALDRALLGQAALALEEELHALAAAELAGGTAVAGH